MFYYFYVLHSSKDGDCYYGSTNDLRRRFHEHTEGRVRATKDRLPVKLSYYEAYDTLDKARKREKQVKKSGSVRIALHNRIFNTRPGSSAG